MTFSINGGCHHTFVQVGPPEEDPRFVYCGHCGTRVRTLAEQMELVNKSKEERDPA